VLGEEGEIVLAADEPTRVAGQEDHVQLAEDAVHGAARQAEVAQVRARKQGAGALEQVGR
jgi:hypothetical protein